MKTAAEWRRWLTRNHAKRHDVWLVSYKKGASKSLGYETALDEATAHGWVDGMVRGATAEYYLQRWVLRRPRGHWTEANRERARRLAEAGRMTPAGVAALPADLRDEIRSHLEST